MALKYVNSAAHWAALLRKPWPHRKSNLIFPQHQSYLHKTLMLIKLFHSLFQEGLPFVLLFYSTLPIYCTHSFEFFHFVRAGMQNNLLIISNAIVRDGTHTITFHFFTYVDLFCVMCMYKWSHLYYPHPPLIPYTFTALTKRAIVHKRQ